MIAGPPRTGLRIIESKESAPCSARKLQLAGHFQGLRARVRYVRLTPFDTSTESGRAAERERKIILTATVGLSGRIASAALALVTVPLTAGYLGPERYGVWLAVSSLVGMMGFLDLGIGNGLLTKVAEADGRDSRDTAVALISSAFLVLAAVALGLVSLLFATAQYVDWADLFGVDAYDARRETSAALITLLVTFCVGMPVGVVQRVQAGLQCGYSANLWNVGASIASLGALLLVARMHGGVVALVLASSGVPVAVTMANFVWYFSVKRPDLWPRLRFYEHSVAAGLLRTGVMYVVLQLAVAFAFISDNFVVARSLGSAAVPTLAVPAKLFQLLVLPVAMVVAPLWPAYGEAAARGHNDWVWQTLRKSTIASMGLAAVGGIFLVLCGPFIVTVWSRGTVNVDVGVLAPLAVWACLYAWGANLGAFLNGLGKVREQAIPAVIMAVAAYGLKWLLVHPLGPGGVAWATNLAYVAFTVVPLTILSRRLQREGLSTINPPR